MNLDQDAAGEAQQGLGVGEDPDDVGAALDLLVDPLEGVGRPDLLPVRDGKLANAVTSSSASRSMASTLGNCRPSIVAITSKLLAHGAGIGLGEDGADRCGDHRRSGALRYLGEHVAQEVHPAALPRTHRASPHRWRP